MLGAELDRDRKHGLAHAPLKRWRVVARSREHDDAMHPPASDSSSADSGVRMKGAAWVATSSQFRRHFHWSRLDPTHGVERLLQAILIVDRDLQPNGRELPRRWGWRSISLIDAETEGCIKRAYG